MGAVFDVIDEDEASKQTHHLAAASNGFMDLGPFLNFRFAGR
jgi:hypothetical protein